MRCNSSCLTTKYTLCQATWYIATSFTLQVLTNLSCRFKFQLLTTYWQLFSLAAHIFFTVISPSMTQTPCQALHAKPHDKLWNHIANRWLPTPCFVFYSQVRHQRTLCLTTAIFHQRFCLSKFLFHAFTSIFAVESTPQDLFKSNFEQHRFVRYFSSLTYTV